MGTAFAERPGKAPFVTMRVNRTPDLLIANEALSQLSYSPALRRAAKCGGGAG